jgi:pimeloyl-ACP methyl ester carboxylesterase
VPSPADASSASAAFEAAYDAMLRLWPVTPTPVDVTTRAGRTHLQVWGPLDAPPLLLLHGFKVTSTMWGPNAAALGSVRRVYAPDTIGDYGRSRANGVPRKLDQLLDWIDGLVDALGLGKLDIGGMSYGGWLAASWAARRPERVGKVVLMAPGATFGSFSLAFALRGLPMLLWKRRGFVDWYLRWAAVPPAGDAAVAAAYEAYLAALVDVMHAGHRHFGGLKPGLPLPQPMPAATMRALAAPTLLLYGDREKMYPAAAAAALARSHVPSLECHVLPDASHDLTFGRAALVNEHLVRFLGRSA